VTSTGIPGSPIGLLAVSPLSRILRCMGDNYFRS
jgi:hypothetical protein